MLKVYVGSLNTSTRATVHDGTTVLDLTDAPQWAFEEVMRDQSIFDFYDTAMPDATFVGTVFTFVSKVGFQS